MYITHAFGLKRRTIFIPARFETGLQDEGDSDSGSGGEKLEKQFAIKGMRHAALVVLVALVTLAAHEQLTARTPNRTPPKKKLKIIITKQHTHTIGAHR